MVLRGRLLEWCDLWKNRKINCQTLVSQCVGHGMNTGGFNIEKICISYSRYQKLNTFIPKLLQKLFKKKRVTVLIQVQKQNCNKFHVHELVILPHPVSAFSNSWVSGTNHVTLCTLCTHTASLISLCCNVFRAIMYAT